MQQLLRERAAAPRGKVFARYIYRVAKRERERVHARSTESKEIRESGKVIATTRDRMCVRLRKIVYNDDIIIFACVIFHAINAVYMRCIRKYYTTARALTNSTLYINILV